MVAIYDTVPILGSPETKFVINPHAEELGLTALELTKSVYPEEYGELYLATHGYAANESAALQQIPTDKVERLRASVNGKLLAAGRMAQIHAVATSIDIGFVHELAQQPDKEVSTEQHIDDNLRLFQLICQGATNPEIAEVLDWPKKRVDNRANEMLKDLNARNRTHLVLRGRQAGLLKPSVPGVTLPDEYLERLHELEVMLGGPIVSLPRSETGTAEKRARGHQNFEEFILDMLDAPDLRIYHPKLAKHFKETRGYSVTQWRTFISKLGEYGITELQIHPGARGAHGIELSAEGLLSSKNRSRPFITDRVLETYERRLSGERAEFALDTSHLGRYFTLKPVAAAALSPFLRTAIGLAHPVMETSFANRGDLLKTIPTFTGQPAKELVGTISALKEHRWLEFNEDHQDNSRVWAALTKKGESLLRQGITRVKEETHDFVRSKTSTID